MVLESNDYGVSVRCNSLLSRSLNQVTVTLTDTILTLC
jgi:hypothetical protein